MRLNNTMREKLFKLIMANAKFDIPSQLSLEEAYKKALNTELPKDLNKFLEKYPEFKNKSRYLDLKFSAIFTTEELYQLQYDGKQCISEFLGTELIVSDKQISSWFKKDNPCEFVKLLKQLIIQTTARYKMQSRLKNFLDNCTTDKQIILTYPEFEKFFNEAGIVQTNGGTTLPVPAELTNDIKQYLK